MDHKQILVIDDDHGVRKTIELSLQVTTDWEVLTAASAEEGLLLAQNHDPDAILLDVMMPDCDGIEVLRQLQNNTATQNIPVIFLTAKALAREQQKLNDLEVKGVIPKPFDAINLCQRIRLLLNWQSDL